MEYAVTAFFKNQGKEDPTKNFGWDYVLVDNDKIVNACVCQEEKLRYTQAF